MPKSRIFIVIMLLLSMAACAVLPMNQPLSAKDEADFRQSLVDLRYKIEAFQYEALQESVDILMLTANDSSDRNSFLRNVIDGRTPQEIINLSEQGREQLQKRTLQ